MKIALVAHYLPPKPGGIEFVVDELARGYGTAGHQVTVAGYATRDLPAYDPPYSRVSLAGWNVMERLGVPVPLLEPISSVGRLKRLLAEADALHVHGLAQPSTMLALLLVRNRNIPVVITEHVGTIAYANPLLRVLQSVVFRIAARLARRTEATVTVLNDRVLEELRSLLHPLQVIKVRNGVDASAFTPISGAQLSERQQRWGIKRRTVLAVGRHVEKKGLDVLAAAARMAGAFDVVFVGPGTEKLTSSDGRCRGLGVRSHHELEELYQSSDLFVLPSRGEGLPLVVLEALASGLPVILGDDPAVRAELPEGAVLYVDATDAANLARTIVELLEDAPRLDSLKALARAEAVERFDWHGVVERYLRLLQPTPPPRERAID